MKNTEVIKFLEMVKADQALSTAVESAETYKDVVLLAESKGFKFSVEDLDAEVNGQGELSDAELESLAGGVNVSMKSTGPATCPCTWMD